MATNYKQLYAIKQNNRRRILAVNPNVPDRSGIYFLTRIDEDGFKFAYIGQAVDLIDRLSGHLNGYQRIDISLKKHGLYSEDNVYGWKIGFLEFPKDKLDEMEQYYIKKYALNGYQLRNKTSGSQGSGKKQIDDYKPSRTYQQGVAEGYKKASKEIAHLFELHLGYYTNNPTPTINQKKALEKFEEFLSAYKN